MVVFVSVEVIIRCMTINPTIFFLTCSAGDSLAYHLGLQFSSKDRDNDRSQHNCALSMKGGWWYNSCQHSNLNGLYRKGQKELTGMRWNRWRGSESVERSEMKLRPNDSYCLALGTLRQMKENMYSEGKISMLLLFVFLAYFSKTRSLLLVGETFTLKRFQGL